MVRYVIEWDKAGLGEEPTPIPISGPKAVRKRFIYELQGRLCRARAQGWDINYCVNVRRFDNKQVTAVIVLLEEDEAVRLFGDKALAGCYWCDLSKTGGEVSTACKFNYAGDMLDVWVKFP